MWEGCAVHWRASSHEGGVYVVRPGPLDEDSVSLQASAEGLQGMRAGVLPCLIGYLMWLLHVHVGLAIRTRCSQSLLGQGQSLAVVKLVAPGMALW